MFITSHSRNKLQQATIDSVKELLGPEDRNDELLLKVSDLYSGGVLMRAAEDEPAPGEILKVFAAYLDGGNNEISPDIIYLIIVYLNAAIQWYAKRKMTLKIDQYKSAYKDVISNFKQ
jgi:hypothetical protein